MIITIIIRAYYYYYLQSETCMSIVLPASINTEHQPTVLKRKEEGGGLVQNRHNILVHICIQHKNWISYDSYSRYRGRTSKKCRGMSVKSLQHFDSIPMHRLLLHIQHLGISLFCLYITLWINIIIIYSFVPGIHSFDTNSCMQILCICVPRCLCNFYLKANELLHDRPFRCQKCVCALSICSLYRFNNSNRTPALSYISLSFI